MRRIKENETGITLVALVVTIVVLLILAGISLSLVLGNNGIITKATDAKDKFAKAKDNETKDLASLDSSMDEMLGKLPRTDETIPYLPTGCSKVSGTNLDTGLVMQDSKGNQYVWVEVPKTTEVYPTVGLSIEDFTDDNYTKIENDLHTYTSVYRDETTNTDTWYSEDQTGLEESEYNTIKKKMLKSVYQNGGFWVGRYEVGDSTSTANNTTRMIDSGITDEAVIKEGQDPYVWITCSQAETLAKTFNPDSSNYNTNLMFGVQWDLIMKYLETKGVSQIDLKTNSSLWGNFIYTNFDITKGRYNVINTSNLELTTWHKVNNKYTKDICALLSTGATERNCKQEMYDLAGNVSEWTLEHSNISNPSVDRGGSCDVNDKIVSKRVPLAGNANSFYVVGFRVSLY